MWGGTLKRVFTWIVGGLLLALGGAAHGQSDPCMDVGFPFFDVFATPFEIRYYIDESIWNSDALFGYPGLGALDGAQAVQQIRQTLDRFHSESGSIIQFVYMGTSVGLPCDSTNLPCVTVSALQVASLQNDCHHLGTFPIAVTYQAPADDGTLGAAEIVLFTRPAGAVPGQCPERDWNAYSRSSQNFPRTPDIVHEVLHEALHLFYGGGHPSSSPNCQATLSLNNSGGDPTMRSLTRYDRDRLRARYGVSTATVRNEFSSLMTPATWILSTFQAANSVVSPVGLATGTNLALAYDVASPGGPNGGESRAKAYVCEPGCEVEDPFGQFAGADYYSYFGPDVAATTGQNPEKWLVASLQGDSHTNLQKTLRLSTKNYGAAANAWSVASLDTNLISTTRPYITTAYDVRSSTSITSVLNGNDYVQLVVGSPNGTVSVFDTGIRALGGASAACTDRGAVGSYNCVLVWADIQAYNELRWERFRFTSVGGVSTFTPEGVIRGLGYVGFSRPDVMARIGSQNDPAFVLTFTQGYRTDTWQNRTIYVRTLALNSTTWAVDTFATSPNSIWYEPPSVGYYAGTHIESAY